MATPSLVYRAAVRLATTLVPVAARFDPKLARAEAARAGVLARAGAWGSAGRDPTRPLAWFHAPSVGEGLQAEAVMGALKALRPRWQLAYTYFSPSAEGLARRVPAEFSDILPFDTPAAAEAMLDALRPSVVVFTKLDLWPELATAAARRGIRVVLVAGTVRPGSGRLGWPARGLLAPGYAAVDRAGTIDAADAARLGLLGTRLERTVVTGDPRYDSVAAKVAAVAKDDPLLTLGAGAPTLVAGSTWEDDEAILAEAFARIRRVHGDARLVVVPHEPNTEHLDRFDLLARRAELPAPARLSTLKGVAPLVVVDRVGVLAALYGTGRMAYVGGGYRRAGLHSVLEPAAWGVPFAMGPRWTESRDAVLLKTAGAAVGLPPRTGDPVGALAASWRRWIEDETARAAAGSAARRIVEEGIGASRRSAELVVATVEG